MRRVSVAVALMLTPSIAWAQTDGYTLDDYHLRKSGDLLDICTLPQSDPQYPEARGFCLGYFAGGIQFHEALAASPDFAPIACPSAEATRDDVVAVFVAYARAHPEHLNEPPMDTVFRAVVDKWPCA